MAIYSGSPPTSLCSRMMPLACLVLAAVVVLAAEGDVPKTEDVCANFNNSNVGCTTQEYFKDFVAPQMAECKALYERSDFHTWLDGLGNAKIRLTHREALFGSLNNRLLQKDGQEQKDEQVGKAQGNADIGTTCVIEQGKGKGDEGKGDE